MPVSNDENQNQEATFRLLMQGEIVMDLPLFRDRIFLRCAWHHCISHFPLGLQALEIAMGPSEEIWFLSECYKPDFPSTDILDQAMHVSSINQPMLNNTGMGNKSFQFISGLMCALISFANLVGKSKEVCYQNIFKLTNVDIFKLFIVKLSIRFCLP